MSTFSFTSAARSAVGLVRSGNEDSALINKQIIAVADGMGGHAAGEVASSLAIKTLAVLSQTFTNPDLDQDSAHDLFINSIHTVDAEITRFTDEDPQLGGMGTTLTSLFLRGNRVALLHVGDSRAYRLRGNTFEQLSLDHTVLQELLSKGTISAAEAADHPQRSMLTQVVMGEGVADPALLLFDVEAKDRFLLCSDGLSGVLTEKEIKSLLKKSSREDAVNALVEATYLNGAPDNVTVIVADVAATSTDSQTFLGAATS